jgi:hypothetical protein
MQMWWRMAVWKEKNVGRITMETDKNITVCVNNFMASLITDITVVYFVRFEVSTAVTIIRATRCHLPEDDNHHCSVFVYNWPGKGYSPYIRAFSLFPHYVMVRKIKSRQ